MNIQGRFPSNEHSGFNGLISLLSRELLGVLSSIIVQKRQFFGTQPFQGPTLRSVHDHCNNVALTITYCDLFV